MARLNSFGGESADLGVKPEAKPETGQEVERIIPKRLKGVVDLAGVIPAVGNVANAGAAGLSAVELGGQTIKGSRPGMKEAAKDLAVDLVGIIPILGNIGKGGKVLATGAKVAAAGEHVAGAAAIADKSSKIIQNGSLVVDSIGKNEGIRSVLARVGTDLVARHGREAAEAMASSVTLKKLQKL